MLAVIQMSETEKALRRKGKGCQAADVLPMSQAKAMALYALGAKRYTAAMVVAVGAGLGLRASDISQVRWMDLVDPDGRPKVQVVVRERKNKRTRVVHVIPWARQVFAECFKALNPSPEDPVVRASRQRMWVLVKELADALGIKGRISPHSLRKSFCDFVYSKTRDPIMAARMTGHANPSHLLVYIGRVPPTEEKVWREIATAEV